MAMGDGAAGLLSNAAMEKTEDPMSLRPELCSELTLCSDSSACTACGAPTVAGRALRLVLAASGARGPLLVAGRGREGGGSRRRGAGDAGGGAPKRLRLPFQGPRQ